VTRREWLQKNPPPRAAAQLRNLLAQLQEQNAIRTALSTRRGSLQQGISHWQNQAYNARASQDTASLTYANAQTSAAQRELEEIDKHLKTSENVPAEITRINTELGNAARCATHKTDLQRHKNRPDDLFVCEVGPHYFLWTAPSGHGAGAFVAWDISRPFPDLDKPME
jgi:chromosome segregation ATPase